MKGHLTFKIFQFETLVLAGLPMAREHSADKLRDAFKALQTTTTEDCVPQFRVLYRILKEESPELMATWEKNFIHYFSIKSIPQIAAMLAHNF